MRKFESEKITDHITMITGITREKMYLIEGSDKACLVDTGIGCGNVADYVSTLTDKPVFVLLTHGHLDHTGGSCYFDEVYIDKKDRRLFFDSYSREAAYEYLKEILGQEIKNEISIWDMSDGLEDVKLNYFYDKQEFELGGVTIKVLECGGHTPGSVVVLIIQDRKLILGDACNNGTYLFFEEALPVEEYRYNLVELKKMEEDWDEVLFSHTESRGQKQIIGEVIRVCDRVLDGTADNIFFSFLGKSGYIAMAIDNMTDFNRMDGKKGNIVYKV